MGGESVRIGAAVTLNVVPILFRARDGARPRVQIGRNVESRDRALSVKGLPWRLALAAGAPSALLQLLDHRFGVE